MPNVNSTTFSQLLPSATADTVVFIVMEDLEDSEGEGNADGLDTEGKRINWSSRETCDLLKVCLKHDFARKLTNGVDKKKKVFEEIHAQMVQLGYVKTLTQIIIKFRNLNQKYKKAVSRISQDNLSRKRLQFWRLMHEVYKHRPIYRITRIEGAAEELLRQDLETVKQIETILKAKEELLQFQQFQKNETDLLNQILSSSNFSDQVMLNEQDASGISRQYKVEKKDEEVTKLDLSSVSSEIPPEPAGAIKKNFVEEEANSSSSSPPPKRRKLTTISNGKPKTEESFNARLMKRSMFAKKARSTESYMRCTRYLVERFKMAQDELQKNFHLQQFELQKQQQEWEEKLLREEREYFGKILLTRDLNVAKPTGAELSDSENENK